MREGGDDFATAAQEGGAQALFDPLEASAGACGDQGCPGPDEEGFAFGELFELRFGVAFFTLGCFGFGGSGGAQGETCTPA